jgi:RNA polymerase sigma-70 factor, ECF subfamily
MQNSTAEQFMRSFLANQRELYALIVSLVPNLADADDLLQEVSGLMWRKFNEFQPGTNFAAWGHRFAKYAVLRHYEKKRTAGRVLFNSELIELLAEEVAIAVAEGDTQRQALYACLAKLPERSRRIIELRYEHDATVRTVAERTGRSVEAIYKALNRAHEALFHCVQRSLAREGAA